jgi:asparagine synthase (glutamine-hydrolysing)
VGATEREDVTQRLERLTDALRHRGPDGCGYHFVRGRSAGLGHRRLSIVDLATGAQPMANEDQRVWVTYNGEIYNHLELRRELEGLGHRFRTSADTECWCTASKHGVRVCSAGSTASSPSRCSTVARRRARSGWSVTPASKPLYLGAHQGTWWFASELGAARAAGLVEIGDRPEALDEFLVYRFIPSPGTPFRKAWKIPPSHFCRLPLAGPGVEPRFERFEADFAPAVVPASPASGPKRCGPSSVRACSGNSCPTSRWVRSCLAVWTRLS